MDSDYTNVWKVLNEGKHVLLLVRWEGSEAVFSAKVDSIREWFKPIVKEDYGPLDLLMANNTWLSIRKFSMVPCPVEAERTGTQVMVL